MKKRMCLAVFSGTMLIGVCACMSPETSSDVGEPVATSAANVSTIESRSRDVPSGAPSDLRGMVNACSLISDEDVADVLGGEISHEAFDNIDGGHTCSYKSESNIGTMDVQVGPYNAGFADAPGRQIRLFGNSMEFYTGKRSFLVDVNSPYWREQRPSPQEKDDELLALAITMINSLPN